MGVRLLATVLPMVSPLASSRGHPALGRTREPRNLRPEILDQIGSEEVATTRATTTIYTPEECDSWISILVENDENDSQGLSESEYYEFLSNIEDPPYIATYFENYDGFGQLPSAFRFVHKSLACHCEKLGFGDECCVGDNAEVLLQGLTDNGNGGTAVEEDYRDSFCQQIAYVLTKSIPSPAPTDGPSISFSPTKSPSSGPTSAPVTGSPTKSPSSGPTSAPVTGSPSLVPSAGPTVSVAPTSSKPTATMEVSPVPNATLPVPVTAVTTTEEEEDKVSLVSSTTLPVPVLALRTTEEEEGKLGMGLVIGIIVACVGWLATTLAFLAHRRRVNERDRLRSFAGDQALEADLWLAPTAAEDREREPSEDDEDDEDDESSASPMWSESEDETTLDELHYDHKDPIPTAGSALAAMGAASTVTARIGANSP